MEEEDNKPFDPRGKKVVIGMTGRVDSAVSAMLLKKQGFDVIGLTIVNNSKDEQRKWAKNIDTKCRVDNVQEIKDICEHIGIQHYATDVVNEFEDKVIDRFVSNRLNMRANSSCFYCMEIRFNVLYSKMKLLKADFIATGHYAKVLKNMSSGRHYIHANPDKDSDQSFLLSQVREKILTHLILPLAELRKVDVIKLAKKFHLPAFLSRDDMKFCYRQSPELNSLLHEKIPESLITVGEVFTRNPKSYIGDHIGMPYYYFGQKEPPLLRAPKFSDELQIVDYDDEDREIYLGMDEELTDKSCRIIRLKLRTGIDTSRPVKVGVKMKYKNEFIGGVILFKAHGNALLKFDEPVYPIISHETLSLYEGTAPNARIIGSARLAGGGEYNFESRVRKYRLMEAGKKKDDDDDDEVYIDADNMFRF